MNFKIPALVILSYQFISAQTKFGSPAVQSVVSHLL
jgi:hypothetical protein